MPSQCAFLADDVEDAIGPRLATWLEQWDHKTLGIMFGASPQTAKRWKCGEVPATKHIAAMLSHWGQGFIDAVLSPLIVDPATLEDRAQRIESDMRALRLEIAHADNRASARRLPELAGAAPASQGRGADSPRARSQSRTIAIIRRRTGQALGVLLCGIALGIGSAEFIGALPAQDEPTPIVRRVPKPSRACVRVKTDI